jgi:flagella basal body P-ring formation protein FlgA
MSTRSVAVWSAVAMLLCLLQPVTRLPQAHLHGQELVPVARHDLPRGVELTDDDIDMAASSGRTGAVGGAGWITRRVIRTGEELRVPAVAPPELVARGEAVELRSTTGTVQLSVAGTAVTGASLGERIQVRIARGWTVEGVVVGPALVALPREKR